MMQNPNGAHHVGVVRQRLSHSHKDYVADSCRRRLEDQIEPEDLLDDLRGRQVSFDAVDTTGAEAAADGAAHLRADTRRAARAVGDHHRFGASAVGPCKKKLLSAVRTLLVRCDNGAFKSYPACHKIAVGLAEICHLGRRRNQLVVHPLPNLSPAKARPSPCRKVRIEALWLRSKKRNALMIRGALRHMICT